jgi:NAD(P)-dependent dehydrogenase (short-subunit alcohol dehydrogenase family)
MRSAYLFDRKKEHRITMNQATLSLEGKVAIVTGASRGLGKTMALALARAGTDVVTAARTPEAIDEAASAIRALGRRSLAIPTDVSNYGAVEQMVSRTIAEFGKIDILVNNSGIAIDKPLLETTEEEWRRVLDVNLNAMFFCAKLAGGHMVAQRKGKIINVASIAGLAGVSNLGSYCVSKGGVVQLTRVLALEWARYNVNVNAIAPGYFMTEMNEQARKDEKKAEALLRRIPLRRFARPEELDFLVVYLASDASDFMTGETIVIDGGQLAN